MNLSDDLSLLYDRLSKGEKKQISIDILYREQESVYSGIVKILQSEGDHRDLKESFLHNYTGRSFFMAVKQVWKKVLRILILNSMQTDPEFILMEKYLEAKVLFRRGFHERGIKKLREAIDYTYQKERNHFIPLLLRTEINFMHEMEFVDMEETELIEKQNKLENSIRYLMSVTKHYSQLEQIDIRRKKDGPVRTMSQEKKMNDLAINEIQIFSNQRYRSFEAEKLHLHFQAVFFMQKGDFRTSIRNFYQLDELYNQNRALWDNPPMFYIHHLDDILYNLLLIADYEKMFPYLARVEAIGTTNSEIGVMTSRILIYYRIMIHLNNNGNKSGVEALIVQAKKIVDDTTDLSQPMMQRVVLGLAAICFIRNEYPLALRYLYNILPKGKKGSQSPLYRNVRMLKMAVHFRQHDIRLFDAEAGIVERLIKEEENHFLTERLLIRFMQRYRVFEDQKNLDLKERTLDGITSLSQNSFERHMFLYIDWLLFVREQ